MKFYQCQDCSRQTTSPKAGGWKQLVAELDGVTIRVIYCAECAPKEVGAGE